MNSLQFPLATQDWTLGKGRALALQAAQVNSIEALSGALWVTVSGSAQDFFVSSGERIQIPCSHGQVVVEATSGAATLRIGQAVDNTPVGADAQSFAHALHVSVLVPVVRSLRRLADWLDPAPAPMRNHRVPA